MKYDLTYNKEYNTVTVNNGILKNYTFPLKATDHGFNIKGNILLTTTDQALLFQDYLDTTITFRQFVQKCLKENEELHGLKATLKMTGLSYTSYKSGINSRYQRNDSGFNKYLRNLDGIRSVFDALNYERATANVK